MARREPFPAVAAEEVAQLTDVTVVDAAAALERRGLDPAYAVLIVGAYEAGKRAASASIPPGARLLDPATIADLMRDVAVAEVEEFWAVAVDVRGRLLHRYLVARGSVALCPVAPGDALRPAVRIGAHGVVFVHNHPSGDPAPSPEDRDLTQRLRAAAEIVGLVARDHVIVAKGGYFSFVEAGCWRR